MSSLGIGAVELAFALCVPAFLGAGLLRALGLHFALDRLAFLGWSQLVGLLSVSLVVFAAAAVGAPLEAAALGSVALGLAAAAHAVGAARSARARSATPPAGLLPAFPADPAALEVWNGAGKGERLLFAAVVALALVFSADVVLRSTGVPVARGDEAFLWASRAKVLYTVGEFGPALVEETLRRPYVQHADYPPLNPLTQVWVFAHAGRIVDVAGRFPLQLLSPALVLVLAAALRRRVRPALAAALLLVVVGQHLFRDLTHFVWSDLAVAVATLVVVDAWLRREEEPGPPWERLVGLGLAALVWTKNEGVLIALALVAGALLASLVREGVNPAGPDLPGRPRCRSPRAAALWTLPALGLLALHRVFNHLHGFANDLAGADRAGDGPLARLALHLHDRFGLVMGFHLREVWFSSAETRLLPGVALVLVVLVPLRVLRGPLLAPGVGLVLVLLAYPVVFLGTATPYVEWHLETAAARVAWHVVPALALWLALAAPVALGGCVVRRHGPAAGQPANRARSKNQ